MTKVCTVPQGTVLIIEKDVHTAYLLDYLLSREGFDVVTTTNCEVAVQLLEKINPVDVVFLDIALSTMDNCHLLTVIRGVPAWHGVPVLLLAEQYSLDNIEVALNAGATDYIVQPFHHSELLTQIRRHSRKNLN